MSDRVFVIAEGGVNHNGSLARALDMVKAAAASGADAVKFQTFQAEKLVTPTASKAAYQQQATEDRSPQFAMLKALELDQAAHRTLAGACADIGVEFMSTAFDVESLAFLIDDIGVRRVKIPSGEVTNPLLLQAAGRSGLPVLLSTGMASFDEIELALGAIAFGMGASDKAPSVAVFRGALQHERSALLARVTVLQCTTAYPAPPEDINLRALDTLSSTFGLPVGFSDHSFGTVLAVAAAGRGAKAIEKHFTLDRSLPGPDHAASLEVGELTRMIADIRAVEKALGTGAKERRPSELDNVGLARRGVYAARDLEAGEIITLGDIALLRPESALSPMELWDIAGKPARRSYRKFEAFER